MLEKLRAQLNASKEAARASFLYTFICMLLCHGYRLCNMTFTDDSIEMLQSTDRDFQIAIGRWGQVIYWKLRGAIAAPFLLSVIAMFFLAASVFLIVRMMNLKGKMSIAALCVLLSVNHTIILLSGVYICWLDICMVSLFLSILAAAMWRQWKFGFLAAVPLLVLSLSLYQCYIESAAVIMILCMIRDLLEKKKSTAQVIVDGVKGVTALLAGLGLYLSSLDPVAHYTNADRFDHFYNSPGQLKLPPIGEIPAKLAETWLSPFRKVGGLPTNQPLFTAILFGILFASGLICLVFMLRKNRYAISSVLMILLLTLMIPFAANAIYFVSNGLLEYQMMFAIFLAFAYPLYLIERGTLMLGLDDMLTRLGLAIAVLVIFFNQAVFANQFYLEKEMEFQTMMHLMNRVIDRIEQREEYEVGVTPVALIGTLRDSKLAMVRPGFEHLCIGDGTTNMLAISSADFYPWYYWEILGYPLNLVDNYLSTQLHYDLRVRTMPSFPAEECCQMIDGVMVVKLGEQAPAGEN